MLKKRLSQIDVLRGVAAFAVFIFHAGIYSGFPKRYLPSFQFFGVVFDKIPSVFSFGATGVNLFFVISGFCLHLKYRSKNYNLIDHKKYFINRIRRIYPAYAVAVFFSFFIYYLCKDVDLWQLVVFLFFAQGFFQQWHFGFNGALWSMSTEVQFYIIFPFVYWLMVRFSSRRLAMMVIAFIFCLGFRFLCLGVASADEIVGGINYATFLMNMIPGRLFEFMLGMVLADYWLSSRSQLVLWSRIFIIPIVIVGLIARINFGTWLADPVLGLMCGLFVVCVISSDWKWFKSDVVAGFGKISYSFFLIHVPVMMVVAKYFSTLCSGYLLFFVISVVTFSVSFFLSRILYSRVEENFV